MKHVVRSAAAAVLLALAASGCSSAPEPPAKTPAKPNPNVKVGDLATLDGIQSAMVRDGFCGTPEDLENPGVIGNDDPGADKVVKSFLCDTGKQGVIGVSGSGFEAAADRDLAAFHFNFDSTFLVGLGDNLWILQAGTVEDAIALEKMYPKDMKRLVEQS